MLKTIPKACFIDNKYCPGCGHGIANRLVAEVLEEMGRDGDALAAIAVGCASLMPDTASTASRPSTAGPPPWRWA